MWKLTEVLESEGMAEGEEVRVISHLSLPRVVPADVLKVSVSWETLLSQVTLAETLHVGSQEDVDSKPRNRTACAQKEQTKRMQHPKYFKQNTHEFIKILNAHIL